MSFPYANVGAIVQKSDLIGHDLVVLVFVDGPDAIFSAPFEPSFNQVYIVVAPVKIDGVLHFRIACSRRDMLPAFEPTICTPSVLCANALGRQFLIKKIINGYVSALRSPALSELLTWGLRRDALQTIISRKL